jgi:hypothetical protein
MALQDLSKQQIVNIQLGNKTLECLKITFGAYIRYSEILPKQGILMAFIETLPLLVLAKNFDLEENNEELVKQKLMIIQEVNDDQLLQAMRLLGFLKDEEKKEENPVKKK